MQVTKCDVCGKVVESKEDVFFWVQGKIREVVTGGAQTQELCRECHEGLTLFLTGKIKEQNTPTHKKT